MIYIILAVCIFSVDFIIKKIVNKKLLWGTRKQVIKDVIVLEKLHNDGAAMGIMRNHKRILNGITIGTILYFLFYMPVALKDGVKSVCLGMSMIIGGALCNGYERVKNGKVTDYIRFPKISGTVGHIVFNLSDFFIMIGGVIIIIGEIKKFLKN